ncbi:Cytochrome c oxidase subunit 4 [Apiotrichum porosum]|uniref:Cytochrome c oxidase subunit 4, mitochondrial n=1 Tax=Apiotrichum porosum TaxID=105984 RepID=A0A427XWA6_9TREE|nr:Cytochrome c oxidase subunit 4 [Apiotrichum porosum]RSH83134.1 Cytochrome c oxidase subunit 4 [Apiotrichum porosum]
MVALLRSLRAARPLIAARPAQAVVPRAFSASALRAGAGGPPQLLGEGVQAGQIPTDEQQATGIERFELLGKVEGVDVFDMTPLEADRIGTLDKPIEVFSYFPERHVGCTGFPADSHDTIWLHLNTSLKNHRCPECGSVYNLKYEAHDSLAHHH